MRVLLIEDDGATAQSIELMLKSESFNVYTTDLSEEGVDLGKLYNYDIILLDLNLPDMSGYEVLRTARLEGQDPHPDPVRSRRHRGQGPRAWLRRRRLYDQAVPQGRTGRAHSRHRAPFQGHAQSIIQTGDLLVNLDTKTVEVSGERVHLTGKEYQMLELFSLRKGTALTKEMFLNHLYGGMDEPELKIIDVFICKLRKKLANASDGKNYIETVWGRGHALREPSEDEAKTQPDSLAATRGFHHHATLCIAAYVFLISEAETIPPSGACSAALFTKPAVPYDYKPRGSAATAPAPHSKLDTTRRRLIFALAECYYCSAMSPRHIRRSRL
jgi:two-component system cell cycle response regulator CtrA